MKPRSRVARLLRNLLNRRRVEQELDDELRDYVERVAAEQIAAGRRPDEARRAALLQLGGAEQIKEGVRDVRAGSLLGQVAQDVRYGLRQMRRAPGFTAVAVITLGVGIGVSAAIFSLVDTVLVRPLPFHEPGRLVSVYEGTAGRGVLAWSEYLAFVEQARTLEHLAAVQPVSATVIAGAQTEQVSGALVSRSLFPMLGVQPIVGRNFSPDEDRPGAGQSALISEGLWRRVFGSDPGIAGQPISLDVSEAWGRSVKRSKAYTVVGVLPATFETLLQGTRGDVWLPLAATPEGSHDLFVVGRMKPDTHPAQVKADLETIAAPLRTAVHSDARPMEFTVTSVLDDLLGDWQRGLLVLLGAVGLVLVIACLNVANLILARGWARSRELAVRAGLGASRGRLQRQILVETLLLAVAGGALAVAVARLSIGVLVGLAPESVARLDQAQLDPRVLLFMGAIVLIAVFVSGLMPAWRLSRSSPQRILQESGRGADESRGSRRLRGALVIVEVALAIVLLVGSGLMVRTLVGLLGIDPGFRTANVLTFRVSLPREAYTTREQRADFFGRLFQDLRTMPGVKAVGINHALPFGGVITGTRMTAVGSTQSQTASWQAVSPDYFEAMTIPILRGRTFEDAEMIGTMQHAMVTRSLAERLWGTQDPIGRQLVLSGSTTPLSVVGVVGETRNGSLDREAMPVVYVPVMPRAGTVVLSRDSNADALVPSIRTALQRVDPVVAPSDVNLMEERVSRSYAVRRFTAMLLGVFACVAAFLGAVGLYGVISFAVGRRTREIGIRRALGAQRITIARLVLNQALRLVAAGLVIGLAAAFGLTRLLSTLLFDVSPTDALTFAVVSMAMVLIAAVACVMPARRAMRLDPATSLRDE